MKDAPQGWPRITTTIYYKDAKIMIDWLCRAFGFEVQMVVEGEAGNIEHSELRLAESLIMIGQADIKKTKRWGVRRASPIDVQGCNTQTLQMYVDDIEAHYANAKQQGATIVDELSLRDYGKDYWADNSYGAMDPEGHVWWISERARG